jgi:hypothetical protein
MAAIYARWIRSGKLTLEEVPEKWRSQVEELLQQ